MGWMVSEAELLRMMSSFMLPLVRIGAFFMAMPIIGTRLVSLRVRAGLAAVLAIAVSGSLPEMPVVDLLSLQSWVIIAEQGVTSPVPKATPSAC